ncbi:MAG: low-complexity tail membrane protein [Cyanobacteria bacterium P01_H01_bin.121]
MRSHWSEACLWLHLAGVATVPLGLFVGLLGLGILGAAVPSMLLLILCLLLGSLPFLILQWLRPFSLFSFLFLSLKPDAYSEQQQRLLRLQRSLLARGLSLVTAITLGFALWKLFYFAPLVMSQLRSLQWPWFSGLLITLIAFASVNFFAQNSMAALFLLGATTNTVQNMPLASAASIRQEFSRLGLPVRRLPLPKLLLAVPEAVTTGSGSQSNSAREHQGDSDHKEDLKVELLSEDLLPESLATEHEAAVENNQSEPERTDLSQS